MGCFACYGVPQEAKDAAQKMEQAVATTKENAAETEKRVMERVEEAVKAKTRLEVQVEELNGQITELKEKLDAAIKCAPPPPPPAPGTQHWLPPSNPPV